MAMSTKDIIRTLGGPSVLARALGLSAVNTVNHWPRRGIPAKYWPDIVEIAAQKRISQEITFHTLRLSRVEKP